MHAKNVLFHFQVLMFCHEGIPYLEVSLNDTSSDKIKNFSTFCRVTFHWLRWLSLPYAVTIIVITTLALIALLKNSEIYRKGMGIFILVLDFLNGVMCLRIFEQYFFREIIQFDGSFWVKFIGWFEYFIIYIGLHLKLSLIIHNMYIHFKNLDIIPDIGFVLSPRGAAKLLVVFFFVCLLEMILMFVQE